MKHIWNPIFTIIRRNKASIMKKRKHRVYRCILELCLKISEKHDQLQLLVLPIPGRISEVLHSLPLKLLHSWDISLLVSRVHVQCKEVIIIQYTHSSCAILWLNTDKRELHARQNEEKTLPVCILPCPCS